MHPKHTITMKYVNFLLIALIFFSGYDLTAQVAISNDGSTADASAILDVQSTTKGMLIPRLTNAGRDAITSPANGLLIYNTDIQMLQVFNGTIWKSVLPGSLCGIPVTDVDGNIYPTVLIGNQCWMTENLKTTTYSNGTPIPNVTNNTTWSSLTSGAYVWYDNDNSNMDKYGALYNWYTTTNPNGLCPTGWHVPAQNEWETLFSFIGGIDPPHGNMLKSCRQVNYQYGGYCSTTDHPRWNEHLVQLGWDTFGFSGLPGGLRTVGGSFSELGLNGYWWSSTASSSTQAYSPALYLYFSYVLWSTLIDKKKGNNIRCIRD